MGCRVTIQSVLFWNKRILIYFLYFLYHLVGSDMGTLIIKVPMCSCLLRLNGHDNQAKSTAVAKNLRRLIGKCAGSRPNNCYRISPAY